MCEFIKEELSLKSPMNVNDLLNTDKSVDAMISNEETEIVIWALDVGLCQAINIFGIWTNIINISIFIKQGFKDSINISLTVLAIADLCSLTTSMSANIFVTPALSSEVLPFDPTEVMFLTSGLPHVTFTRITGWITALITLERCLCITAPLKVRDIITPRRVTVVLICVFALLMASVAPMYVVNRLGTKFYPEKNKTLFGIVKTEHAASVEMICYAINNVCLPFSSFLAIIVCTVTLVVKLQKTSKWRQQSITSVHGDNVSRRNQKVAKMVVMISTLFICCFAPVSVVFIAMSMLPDLSVVGKFRNMVLTVGALSVILESINSSSNIFIYYQMSSNYRDTFRQIFLRET